MNTIDSVYFFMFEKKKKESQNPSQCFQEG